MTFVNAIKNQETQTENGMRARKSTANANVDLFFKIGASRGRNIIPEFISAFVENPETAIRIAMWARDVRGGAGERQLFRDILSNLQTNRPDVARILMHKIPEIGRWDDLLTFNGILQTEAFTMIQKALENKNGLCAKWMPRQGVNAIALRNFLGWSPKRYRKTLVTLTKVVETQMCAQDWDDIEFAEVPSVAAARYKKAFNRHTLKFAEYVEKLTKGESKVNAGAVYPYDVLKGVAGMDATELKHVIAQWDALPNYVGDASIFPLVDVSGSMESPAGKNKNITCMDISVSLGLYLSDKNKGVFNGAFLTFSSYPELLHLQGNIVQKMAQMKDSKWGYSTNLNKALDLMLNTAVKGNVVQSEMPQTLLILSDMQFDADNSGWDDTAKSLIGRKYSAAGYNMPNIVFWNLSASYENVPVKFDELGVAMVSGFSPVIMKAVLAADFDKFTPEAIMNEAIMIDRYNWLPMQVDTIKQSKALI